MLKEGLDAYRYHNVILDEEILSEHGMPKGFLQFILDKSLQHYSNRGVSNYMFQDIVDAYLKDSKGSYTESVVSDRYYQENMFITTSPNSQQHYRSLGCIDLNGPLIPISASLEYDLIVGSLSGLTTNTFKKLFRERTQRFKTVNQVFMSIYAACSTTKANFPVLFNRGNDFYTLFEECRREYSPIMPIVIADDDAKGKLKYFPKTPEESYKVENLDYYFTII